MPKKPSSNKSPEPAPQRRVTLRDIGRELGVSHVTVSLALRNNPQISEQMRIRVREKADEMGYIPDPMLSALANYRLANQQKPTQAALAWINPLAVPGRLRKQQEFNLYWEGAADSAGRMGFRLEEFAVKEIPLHRMAGIFKARSIRGILIAPLLVPDIRDLGTDWTVFPWQDFAVVRFGRSTVYPSVHFITSAQNANTRLAYTCARDKGYQRIGFAGQLQSMRVFGAGFFMAQWDAPEAERLPLLFLKEKDSPVRQAKMLEAWIKQSDPDAIVTDIPELLQMLGDLGVRVPDDIGLATTSIHDTPINAGIDQNPEEIGRAAIRTLIALLNENNFGIPSIRNEILIEGQWVDGTMLPPRFQ